MADSCIKVSSKFIILLLGVLFWGSAALLGYIGGVVFSTYGHYDSLFDAKYTLIPASIVLVVAGFLFLIGLMGCCGACTESKCLLATFFTVSLIVFCFELALPVLGYVYWSDVESYVQKDVGDAFSKYGFPNETSLSDQIDFMQNKLECCGDTNLTDWMNTWYYKNNDNTVPQSCCMNYELNQPKETLFCNASLSQPEQLWAHGCVSKLEHLFARYRNQIALVGGPFVGIQILGLICSCVLFCRKREVPYTKLTTNGYRA